MFVTWGACIIIILVSCDMLNTITHHAIESEENLKPMKWFKGFFYFGAIVIMFHTIFLSQELKQDLNLIKVGVLKKTAPKCVKVVAVTKGNSDNVVQFLELLMSKDTSHSHVGTSRRNWMTLPLDAKIFDKSTDDKIYFYVDVDPNISWSYDIVYDENESKIYIKGEDYYEINLEGQWMQVVIYSAGGTIKMVAF